MIIKRVDAAYIQSKQFENDEISIKRDAFTFVELFICMLIMMIILSGLIFYNWMNLEFLRNQYELRALEARLRQLKDENQKLILEAEYLSSIDRIDKVVVKEFDLRPTDLSRIIILPNSGWASDESVHLAKK